MFTLKIETDNAAFGYGNGAYELERLLREIGETIRLSVPDTTAATAEGTVRDANGNRVGAWSLNAPEDELEGALSLPPEDAGTAPALLAMRAGSPDLAWPDVPPPDGDEASDEREALLNMATNIGHLAEARGYGGAETLRYAIETFAQEREEEAATAGGPEAPGLSYRGPDDQGRYHGLYAIPGDRGWRETPEGYATAREAEAVAAHLMVSALRKALGNWSPA